jgi:hypothetical protein
MEKLTNFEDDAKKAKESDNVVIVGTMMEGKPFSSTKIEPTTTIAELQDILISTGDIPKSTKRRIFSIKVSVAEI